ncbi:hypothetical protein MBLNU459_g0704t2 [Dothideomycetes sp. NU459]
MAQGRSSSSSSSSSSSPVLAHLNRLLTTRQPPKTFCPSEVARALSRAELATEHVQEWRDLMPRIRALVWERRDHGELQVLQRGRVLGEHVSLADVRGPIRVRRVERSEGPT